MSHAPLNLTARDFDAYAPEKATSNAYSRPRLEVKQRALGWARGVVARLATLGLAVDVHASDEHPTLRNKKRVDCQWVFFWRDQAARDELDRLLDRARSISQVIDDPSPYTRHAFLALRLDAQSVEVCFAVHPEAKVDVDNLRARLAEAHGQPALADELMAALRALPDEFTIGVRPEDRIDCASATPEAIRTMLERAAAGQVPLWIGWRVNRETAVEHSALLDEQLEDAIVALGPVYQLIAWSRGNDHVALDRRIESAEQERARAHAEVEAQTERWRAEQEEARRRSQAEARARGEERRGMLTPPAPAASGARPSLANLFKEKESRAPAAQRTPPPPRAEVAEKAAAAPAPAASPAVAPPAAPPAAPPGKVPIERGTKVRVLAGPFAEKVGVVGELDGRGGARVLLGLLSTRVEIASLEPVIEGREGRPAIQSSHRRPIASAPRKAR
jgi:hypothetical protein